MGRDFSGAEGLVQGYLRQNPSSPTALQAAARLAIAKGERRRGRAILAWLRDNGYGRDVRLLCDLAILEAQEGDFAAAEASARAAYRLQRTSPIATQALGFTYAASGKNATLAHALLDKAQAITGITPLIAEARQQLWMRREG